MASLFPTLDVKYNNQKIGFYQGADMMFFDDAVLDGRDIRNFMRSMLTLTDQAISGSVLVNSLFSPAYGHHWFSAPTGQSKCSMYLPVPSTGMRLVVDCINFAGDANLVLSNVAGAAIKRASGSTISTINVSAVGIIELVCTTDGTWSVLSHNASATPDAA